MFYMLRILIRSLLRRAWGACCSFYSVTSHVLDALVSKAVWVNDEFSIARPRCGDRESGKVSEGWDMLVDSSWYRHITLFQPSVHTYSISALRVMLDRVMLRDTNQIHSTYCPDNSAMLQGKPVPINILFNCDFVTHVKHKATGQNTTWKGRNLWLFYDITSMCCRFVQVF